VGNSPRQMRWLAPRSSGGTTVQSWAAQRPRKGLTPDASLGAYEP